MIYAAEEPATVEQLADAVGVGKTEVRAALDELVASYAIEERGVEIRRQPRGFLRRVPRWRRRPPVRRARRAPRSSPRRRRRRAAQPWPAPRQHRSWQRERLGVPRPPE